MTAADILRERARQTENVSSAAFAPTSPDLLRAVADLMERVARYRHLMPFSVRLAHDELEKLIQEARDADR